MILRNRKDLASGLMYVTAGLAFAILSAGYDMGTPVRMGPGYFPFWLGCILALLGAVLVAGSVRPSAAVDTLSAWDLRALLVILVSVVAFGFLLKPAGLFVSVAALVLAGSFASREFSWGATLLNAAVLAAVSVVIFVYGLGLHFAVWPEFLGG